MSTSQQREKDEKRSKFAVWFNELFRTKLEKDTHKILEMMTSSNENQVRGDTTFYYSRGNLQKAVMEKLKFTPKFITVNDLSASYWCDVPSSKTTRFLSSNSMTA